MGKGGGKKSNPLRDMAEMLAAVRDSHNLAAEAVLRAYKDADGADPHSVAAGAAVACAHMEAASRYMEAAGLLTRGIGLSSCGNLHTTYLRRIASLVGRSASLSAKSSKIMGSLPDVDQDEHEEIADSMRLAKRLAAESAGRARAAYDGMRTTNDTDKDRAAD